MGQIIDISGSRINDRGILRLMEYVDEHLPDFTLVIGCKPGIYDVDAILIGRGNIYAIECKNWKGDIYGGSYGRWSKDSEAFSNPLHQARNNAAALSSWIKMNVTVKGKLWVDSLVVFTHDNCSLTLELDESSNTSVSVLLLDELKKWVTERKSSVISEIENEVLHYFDGLNGEKITTDRRMYAPHRKSDRPGVKAILVIVAFVISVLIALSNRSLTGLVFAIGMGFVLFIVLSSDKNQISS